MTTFLARAADWIGPASPTLLLDVTVKGAAVLLAALVVTRLMGGRSASARHHVWTLAFVLVLALPALGAVLPGLQVTVPGWPGPAASADISTATEGIGTAAAAGDRFRVRPSALERLDGTGRLDASPATPATSDRADVGGGPGLAGVLLATWLVGATLLLGRLGFGIVSAWWTARGASPLGDVEWTELLAELSAELGVARPVRLLESGAVSTPMAWGIVRPCVLLPDDARRWSPERRRAVLLHELGHVRRGDCLVHLLAQAARAVHWVNPLAWIGTRRLHAERERACDDLVLAAGTRGADYARLLLDVARGRRGGASTFAAVSMARPSELEGRLLAVLDESRDRRGLSRVAALAWALAAIALVLPLAALRAVPAASAEAPEAAVLSDAAPGARPARAPAVLSDADATARAATRPKPRGEPQAAESNPDGLPRVLDGTRADRSLGSTLAGLRPEIETAAVDTLEQRVLDAFLRALSSDRIGLRAQAAHALGQAESHAAVGPLARLVVDDESAAVRAEAAWALGMIESAEAVDALARAVGDEAAAVRSQAAWALGMIEDADGVDGLIGALDDASAEVRAQVAWALGMIEDATATEPLMRRLAADASAEVRAQIAWALGMIEDDRALDALIDALEDEDDGVAEKAMWALGRVMR